MANAYRIHAPGETYHGKLDREYLRISACFRLIRQGRLRLYDSVPLLSAYMPEHNARALVSIWKRHFQANRHKYRHLDFSQFDYPNTTKGVSDANRR